MRELPPGYEVTYGIPDNASPVMMWGLGAGVQGPSTQPAACATLADPAAARERSAQGVSGSGSGGIVAAVAVEVRPVPVTLDRDVVAECPRWTLTAARGTAVTTLVDAPRIDGADTLGMVANIRTSVESGTEIDSRVYTFTAYLGDCYAFTTLTTDPGSALPALGPQFAADPLVKTVATLRG